jgi:hypothetical protein
MVDDYVQKQPDGSYSLTSVGRDYIVHRYEVPTQTAHSILLIVVKNGEKYLMRRRLVQPLLGYTGFVHGEPVLDSDVVETAKGRLLEKTGLSVELTVKGSALIAQYNQDELQSYSHAVILYGESTQSHIHLSDATGENFGSSPTTYRSSFLAATTLSI